MNELRALLARRPFVPFRLHLSDQAVYEIRHPEMVSVGRRVTFIGIARENVEGNLWDEPVLIYNNQITRLEPIVPAATPPAA